MSERPDLPKIKPKRAPGLLSYETLDWALNGWIIGDLVSFFSNREIARKPVLWTGMIMGAVAGAVIGKDRQEREQAEGKTVSDPTYWNSGLGLGAAAIVILAIPMGAFHSLASSMTTIAASLGAAALGSVIVRSEMQQDFNQALAARDALAARGQNVVPYIQDYSITRAEMRQIEQKRPYSHTEQVQAAADSPTLTAHR